MLRSLRKMTSGSHIQNLQAPIESLNIGKTIFISVDNTVS
jgi:hypothetical protein